MKISNQALTDVRAQITALELELTPLNERIDAIRGLMLKAQEPGHEAERLTAERKALLADAFLTGKAVDTTDLDKRLGDAQKRAAEAAPTIEAAQSAIAKLEIECAAIAGQIHELAGSIKHLQWEALREALTTKRDAYDKAQRELAKQYVEIAGIARACDDLVNAGDGRPFTGFKLANLVEVLPVVCHGFENFQYTFDLTGDIQAAKADALRAVA